MKIFSIEMSEVLSAVVEKKDLKKGSLIPKEINRPTTTTRTILR